MLDLDHRDGKKMQIELEHFSHFSLLLCAFWFCFIRNWGSEMLSLKLPSNSGWRFCQGWLYLVLGWVSHPKEASVHPFNLVHMPHHPFLMKSLCLGIGLRESIRTTLCNSGKEGWIDAMLHLKPWYTLKSKESHLFVLSPSRYFGWGYSLLEMNQSFFTDVWLIRKVYPSILFFPFPSLNIYFLLFQSFLFSLFLFFFTSYAWSFPFIHLTSHLASHLVSYPNNCLSSPIFLHFILRWYTSSAMQNLQNLLRMPYGCGQQNMVLSPLTSMFLKLSKWDRTAHWEDQVQSHQLPHQWWEITPKEKTLVDFLNISSTEPESTSPIKI